MKLSLVSLLSLLALIDAAKKTYGAGKTRPQPSGTQVYRPGSGTVAAEGLNPLLQPISSADVDYNRRSNASTGATSNGRRTGRTNPTKKKGSAPPTNSERDGENGNGKKLDYTKEQYPIPDAMNSGWHLFKFGRVGQEARPTFAIKSKEKFIRMRITDMYYPGDRFIVYDKIGSRPEVIIETPSADCDGRHKRITDPNGAFKSKGIWSKAEVMLPPGQYHIVIEPLSSPFEGGTAAIRFDTMENIDGVTQDEAIALSDSQICAGWGGYVVVRSKTDIGKQGPTCQLLGLANVDLESDDQDAIYAISKTLVTCMADKQLAWIQSLDGDERNGQLAARVADKRFQVEARSKTERHQVLCRVIENS